MRQQHGEIKMHRQNGNGSGLSLERFIRGKARPNKGKGESAGGKRKRVEKAVLLRNYRKEKQRVNAPAPATAADDSNAPKSFYDKFFATIKNDGDDNISSKSMHKSPTTHKPDPLFKAKRKAQLVKDERNVKRQIIEQKVKEKEKKVEKRKKRHVKLSLRTKTGQPVVKHQIKDILAKLKSSQ
ncbi:hypothetical protein H310_08297 [Aphanomyces invadans]|uniref:rRNA-processing protein FYV7 n=1 Tax=Aphanomyces invadans TaxID=157072 RepID=A0A024TZJ7_9STRA|nr:hypothetical protein H310_08297 [Aphanomyces invadans]ETV98787.1 hypothetical protein H310_08297 [Aphanomyces invadans]|eukprot:XP_008872215.1 hypothetical protein H310_08297 [Aphanomyces invadans]